MFYLTLERILFTPSFHSFIYQIFIDTASSLPGFVLDTFHSEHNSQKLCFHKAYIELRNSDRE